MDMKKMSEMSLPALLEESRRDNNSPCVGEFFERIAAHAEKYAQNKYGTRIAHGDAYDFVVDFFMVHGFKPSVQHWVTEVRRKVDMWAKKEAQERREASFADIPELYEMPYERDIDNGLLREALAEVMATLPPRTVRILELTVMEDVSCAEAGVKLGMTRMQVWAERDKGLRKLRHPSRAKKLKGFY